MVTPEPTFNGEPIPREEGEKCFTTFHMRFTIPEPDTPEYRLSKQMAKQHKEVMSQFTVLVVVMMALFIFTIIILS